MRGSDKVLTMPWRAASALKAGQLRSVGGGVDPVHPLVTEGVQARALAGVVLGGVDLRGLGSVNTAVRTRPSTSMVMPAMSAGPMLSDGQVGHPGQGVAESSLTDEELRQARPHFHVSPSLGWT